MFARPRSQALGGQLDGQAEPLGQQGRALGVAGAEGAVRPGEADMVQRPAAGQAVLADQPEPSAAGPGQLGSVIAGRLESAVQGLPEQPRRALEVADVMLNEVKASRRPGLG